MTELTIITSIDELNDVWADTNLDEAVILIQCATCGDPVLHITGDTDIICDHNDQVVEIHCDHCTTNHA